MIKRSFAAVQDSYRKQPVTMRVALIGAAATLVAAFIAGVATVAGDLLSRPPAESDSDLRIVGARVIEAGGPPRLDVQLRNPGDKVAFLKRADFVVRRVEMLDTTATPRAAVPPSGSYEVVLPSEALPQNVSVAISHSLQPNEVDRFLFVFHPDVRPGRRYAFWVDFTLIYDEDDKLTDKRELYFETGGG